MTKAVVLLVPDESADEIGRLIASTLSLNGYSHNDPAVLDLWEDPKTDAWTVFKPSDAMRYARNEIRLRHTVETPQPWRSDIADLLGEVELLRMVLGEARDELARWGWGDFHYGSTGQEKSVTDALAKIDGALGREVDRD